MDPLDQCKFAHLIGVVNLESDQVKLFLCFVNKKTKATATMAVHGKPGSTPNGK